MVSKLFVGPLALGIAMLLCVAGAGWCLTRWVHPLAAIALYLGSMLWAILYAVETASRCRSSAPGCSDAAAFTDSVTAYMVVPTMVLIFVMLTLRTVVGMREDVS